MYAKRLIKRFFSIRPWSEFDTDLAGLWKRGMCERDVKYDIVCQYGACMCLSACKKWRRREDQRASACNTCSLQLKQFKSDVGLPTVTQRFLSTYLLIANGLTHWFHSCTNAVQALSLQTSFWKVGLEFEFWDVNWHKSVDIFFLTLFSCF